MSKDPDQERNIDDRWCYILEVSTPTPNTIPGRRTRTRATAPEGTAVAYCRVSTDEQVASGAGLDAQRAAIEAEAERRGLTIIAWFTDDGISGSVEPDRRPGLAAALALLKDRTAGRLVAAKLDRLGRSAIDLLNLDRCAEREGWGITLCDLDLDTSTPHGRAMLTDFAGFAQFERDMIAQRTRDALAARKAAGMQLGTPTQVPDEVLTRIIREAAEGRSLRKIAAGLMADGIPTGSGKATWHPPQVQRALDCQRAHQLAVQLFDTEDVIA